MLTPSRGLPGALLLFSLAACATPGPDNSGSSNENTVLAEWVGPYAGVPAFDRVQLEHLKPALKTAMATHLAELDVIAQKEAAPTFENTIVAMEQRGRDMKRVSVYMGIWRSNLSGPQALAIQKEMAPKIAAYRSQITQNQ